MDRVELLNAMRVLKDYCESIEMSYGGGCPNCKIGKECIDNFKDYPCCWKLENESNMPQNNDTATI